MRPRAIHGVTQDLPPAWPEGSDFAILFGTHGKRQVVGRCFCSRAVRSFRCLKKRSGNRRQALVVSHVKKMGLFGAR